MQIRMALAQQIMTQLQESLTDKCFKLCVAKPSSSRKSSRGRSVSAELALRAICAVGSSEQACLTRCCDRYIESFSLVTSSLVEHSQRCSPVPRRRRTHLAQKDAATGFDCSILSNNGQ